MNYNSERTAASSAVNVRRGEIFWCDFDHREGSETMGRRPIVVVSNDKCNVYSPTISVVPLTTAYKKPMPTHCKVLCNGVFSTALCEQITTVSKDRICEFISAASEDEMKSIERGIQVQLGLDAGDAEECNGFEVMREGYTRFACACQHCGSIYSYGINDVSIERAETECPRCHFVNEHYSGLGLPTYSKEENKWTK